MHPCPLVPSTRRASRCPTKDYVSEVLATQVDLQADGLDFVPVGELPSDHRYFTYQKTVNAGGNPSEQVIDENRARSGRDYRDETEGDHPITDLRHVHAS